MKSELFTFLDLQQIRPALAVEQSTVGTDKKTDNNVSEGGMVQVAPAASQVIIGQDQFYDFDSVFGPNVSQKELYSLCLEELVAKFIQG